MLGLSNLVLLFVAKALAAEQLAGDKARLNLEVLQRQVGTRSCMRLCMLVCVHARMQHACASMCSHARMCACLCGCVLMSVCVHARVCVLCVRACMCVHVCKRQAPCTNPTLPSTPVANHRPPFATPTPHPVPLRCPPQAKGLQAEYQRATSGASAGSGAAGASEEARLRGQVDALIREKGALQATVDGALAAKKSAEARVDAITAQSKVRAGCVRFWGAGGWCGVGVFAHGGGHLIQGTKLVNVWL